MLNTIIENHPDEEILKADGFDDAVIGIAIDFTEPRLIYSVKKCLEILTQEFSEDCDPDDDPPTMAMEHFTYNVSGSYVGEKTPIWCWDLD